MQDLASLDGDKRFDRVVDGHWAGLGILTLNELDCSTHGGMRTQWFAFPRLVVWGCCTGSWDHEISLVIVELPKWVVSRGGSLEIYTESARAN